MKVISKLNITLNMKEINFPTELHKKAVGIVTEFFERQKCVDTILLTNSIARGKATSDSDIDLTILVTKSSGNDEINYLENIWQRLFLSHQTLNQFRNSSQFAHIHLDIINGNFRPQLWEDGGGIDFFEVEIGNRLLYSKSLAGEGEYFLKLKSEWLPYYNDTLQKQRLSLAKNACIYELV